MQRNQKRNQYTHDGDAVRRRATDEVAKKTRTKQASY
jgi:hypothetical protein